MENQPPRKPIAYDVNAQPIYEEDTPASHVTAAPQIISGENYDPRIRTQYANEPDVVHTSREVNPKPFEISEENMERTRKSREQYPHLNISDGEYVVFSLKRHPIGLFTPVAAGGLVLLVFLVALIVYPIDTTASGLPSFAMVAPFITLVMALVGVGTAIAIWVYLQNQFYLTSESVIQEVQNSLFSRHEQTVSLGSIEDASFKQNGILQHLLNYGTIRLSTEGEETTYRFQYVENPREQVAVLNNAVEAFKNGRPVNPYES
ncbi:MAG: PH domain-containing protein [Candidatus Saccharimonadales bacterium]